MKNLNLVEKLKRCPKGTKLYSVIHGKVYLESIKEDCPIIVNSAEIGDGDGFSSFGLNGAYYPSAGECTLFSSPEKLPWDLFHYALAGEYVTVISLNRKGKELKYICQVEKDGVFDVENSKVSKSNGVIGKNLVEVRAATKEEIEKLNPRFKKGEIVRQVTGRDVCVITDVREKEYEIFDSVNKFWKKDSSLEPTTEKEKKDYVEFLKKGLNLMLKNNDVVPWRADTMDYYHFVTDSGGLTAEMDDYRSYNSIRYKVGNYFATENLAKASKIYKTFHP